MTLAQYTPTEHNAAANIIHYNPADDTQWLTYYNIDAAYQAVLDHCRSLPSYRTPEQHTYHAYKSGLDVFLEWLQSRLPTKNLIKEFIAHLKADKNLAATTISSKYLAPVRLFLQALGDQHITVNNGSEYLYVNDCRQHIMSASRTKNPKRDTSTNRAPVDATGNRLTKQQVNDIFMSIDTSTVMGKRDLALLYIGFTSGMRNAELRQITINSIQLGTTTHEVHVRRKRNNMDPVPIDIVAVNLIDNYIDAYNTRLEEEINATIADLESSDIGFVAQNFTEHDDAGFLILTTLAEDEELQERIDIYVAEYNATILQKQCRITEDTPIWQPMIHGDNYAKIGINGYHPSRGISAQAIRNILKRYAAAAGIKAKITAHDMRRTISAIMRDEGADYGDIQMLLGHKNIATTFRYLGKKQDLSKALASNYVAFQLPT